MNWNDFFYDLNLSDLLIIALGAAFIYMLLFPPRESKTTLTPRELRNALEIQNRRRCEFSSAAWIAAELPRVRGGLWQLDGRI